MFLSLVVVTTLSGFGAACGVKGPLYFPTEEEIQMKKEREREKEKDKTSKRKSVPANATLS